MKLLDEARLDERLVPAVERGVALLDERVPRWRERVEVLDLDMASCSLCVLGQLFATATDSAAYRSGCTALGLTAFDGPDYGFSVRLGELVDDPDALWKRDIVWKSEAARREAYDRLRDLWIKQIQV